MKTVATHDIQMGRYLTVECVGHGVPWKMASDAVGVSVQDHLRLCPVPHPLPRGPVALSRDSGFTISAAQESRDVVIIRNLCLGHHRVKGQLSHPGRATPPIELADGRRGLGASGGRQTRRAVAARRPHEVTTHLIESTRVSMSPPQWPPKSPRFKSPRCPFRVEKASRVKDSSPSTMNSVELKCVP